jgi:hypothetical protein
MRLVQKRHPVTRAEDYAGVESFAAIISSRLAAEARISKAISFCWLCGGLAIASCLIGLGCAIALYGYSTTLSLSPAAAQIAEAVKQSFAEAAIHTVVEGEVTLAPDTVLTLAPNQTIRLAEGTSVSLDPNSSVKVVGDVKVDIPQPSKQQLQVDATSGSNELPSTQYTVFKSVAFGAGYVVTGWSFDLSDTSKPFHQRCYFEQRIDRGLAATQTVAINGFARPVSTLAKLPFDFDGAVANCIWFSG